MEDKMNDTCYNFLNLRCKGARVLLWTPDLHDELPTGASAFFFFLFSLFFWYGVGWLLGLGANVNINYIVQNNDFLVLLYCAKR